MRTILSHPFIILSVVLAFAFSSCESDTKSTESDKSITKERPVKSKPKKKVSTPSEKSKPAVKSKSLSETISLGRIDYNLINARLLQKVNQERKRLNLPILKNNNDLVKAAKIHNDYMVKADILDHTEAGTSTPTMRDRITRTGGKFRTAGENIQYEGFIIRTTNGVESIIAPTYEALAEQLWQNWKTSPPHYVNIKNPEFKYIGTSLKWSDKKTAVFATQVYGG